MAAYESHGAQGGHRSGAETHASHESHESHGSLKSYVIGFVLSLVLTAIPLMVVLNDWLEGTRAHAVLFGAAILQFPVQLIFFMHLREEKKPRYNLMTLLLGLIILVLIVGGSIWIMTYNQIG